MRRPCHPFHQRRIPLKRCHLPSNTITNIHTSSPKGSAATSSIETIAEGPQEAQQAGMAASFLQFCATCEKQIFTPCNTILYCSEA
jgi:hypothetical protein